MACPYDDIKTPLFSTFKSLIEQFATQDFSAVVVTIFNIDKERANDRRLDPVNSRLFVIYELPQSVIKELPR